MRNRPALGCVAHRPYQIGLKRALDSKRSAHSSPHTLINLVIELEGENHIAAYFAVMLDAKLHNLHMGILRHAELK